MAVFSRTFNLLSCSKIRGFLDSIFVADILKFTASVLRAIKTSSVVIGEKQIEYYFPGLHHTFTHGLNDHAFFDKCIAGGRQFIHTFHFYYTQTAGTDLIYFFQITQCRNPDSNGSCCFKDRCSFLHFCLNSVNFQINHSSRPPFSTPHPK